MARVKIKKLPKALSGLEIKMQPGLYGTNGNRQFTLPTQVNSQKFAQQPTAVRDTLQPVAREDANLEAEKGETAVVNIDGLSAHFKIGGKRHSQGGTPLSLPDNSFIFSDTAKMKIKDPTILEQFGMSKKAGGYTPAEIAKKYDVNTYRKILSDPNSEDLERKTAEMMISNYNDKLAKLSLAQESMKGFPQGIPVIAMPYIMANQIDPAQYLPTQSQQEEPDADTGEARYGGNMISQFDTKAHGGMHFAGYPYYQDGAQTEGSGFWGKVGSGLLSALEAPQRAMMYVGTGLFGDQEYEMFDPKTQTFRNIHEDNVEMFKNKGWKVIKALPKAHYEMPGETLKRTYPESSPWLQGAADIFADPFLVSGLAKTGARLATKKLIKETSDAIIKGAAKDKAKEEVIIGIITKAGKTVNEKNKKIVEKALDAGVNAMMKAEKKGVTAQAKSVEKAVAKAAGRTRQVEDIKQASQKATELGKFAYEKGIKPAAKAVKKAAGKVGEFAVDVAQAATGPYAGPIVTPVLKNIPGAVTSAKYRGEAEDLKKQVKEQQKQIETLKSSEEDKWLANPEAGYYYKASKPSEKYVLYNREYTPLEELKDKFIMYKGRYTPIEKLPPEVTDTLGMSADMPTKEYGGSIDQYDGGGEAKVGKGGKFIYYEDGSVYNVDKKKFVTPADPNWKPKDIIIQKKPATKKSSIDLFPEEEAERQKWIASNPDSTVDADTYDRLVDLYNKAKKADPTGTKKTKEAEEFQRAYHDVLPQTAGKIIATAGKKTKKALAEGRTWWDLEGNVDGYFGPRTEQYFEELQKKKPKEEEEKELPEVKKDKDKGTVAAEQDVKRYPPMGIRTGQYAPWWLQDIIKTAGAAGDLARINRYLPWQATPAVRLPEATFYDPTRELAANTEQANLAMQAQQAFTNPQQLAAASSLIQGQALKNAADIMGRYNNLNVGLANQLEQQRTEIMNTANQNKANLDTQLWDKYTIANQQFDNAKAQARQNLRQSYIDAITNRAKTQALNTLYPNYYADPSRGGMVDFAPGYGPFTPTESDDNQLSKKVNRLVESIPGLEAKDALNYYKKNESSEDNQYDKNQAYLKALGIIS